MIEQKSVSADDKSTPSIADIREKISDAIDATTGTAFERLQTWLQASTDATVKAAMDKNCKGRADDLAARLSSDGKAYKPSSLSSVVDAGGAWKTINAKLAAGLAVPIEGASSHVCGDKSYFVNKERDLGFHVVVFLAVGADTDEKPFYVGLDPDVSATAESRAKWIELVPTGTKLKELEDTGKSSTIIKAMVLGGSTSGLGPLVRKYYVDTTKKFPPITRV